MKKEKKKIGGILVTLFIALSMIVSIFAIVLDNQGHDLVYNKYKFSLIDTGYRVKVNDKLYTFQYFPAELETYNLSQQTKDTITNSQGLAILFDPNSSQDDLTYIDYSRFSLDEAITKPVYFAITSESAIYQFPVLSCENSTKEVPFIFFNISSVSSIEQYGNCIVLNARLREIIAVQERIAYQELGIMK